MTLSSCEHTVPGRRPRLSSNLFRPALSLFQTARTRMADAWQQHRTERAFEGLSYDTLKDIGFPSATAEKTGKPAR
ncbi:hypothetical protein [Pararhizobium antarcticum]|uniref:DUF1127 domain-containing protein n=1 Tax=Pararhizobium antarcticum TaxID=1798805 RepID=A0A657LTZ7_9HYPH|nr:hypothetical protein [Pararhizobium antarcticum]OJF91953.1 hypothetical protein AX761_05545 [Rhizobium sp. 58]OJF98336.1 hypothetical protein AX760_14605 [Pararhizobium antarcticum]